MNSKRWLFPCLFRVFVIQISVNTQGPVKVAQAVPQHLSQDWERDSQLTEVDHAYSLLYKSRYVYNTSVPHHVVRIARALARNCPFSHISALSGIAWLTCHFGSGFPWRRTHVAHHQFYRFLIHTHTLSLSYPLSLRSLFPSLVALHHPWTATACISLANGSWILVDPPRVPAPCAVFVSMRRYSSSTHSTPISPLSFEAVKPLRRRLSLGHVAPLSLRAPSVAISASVLLLSYLRIPRHSSRHLVPYGLGSLS